MTSSECPATPAPVLTDQQLEEFQRDGCVVVRGLLDEKEVDRAVREGVALTQVRKAFFFSTILKGAMYNNDGFRSLALHSRLPQAAAELMQLNPETQNVRILRYV